MNFRQRIGKVLHRSGRRTVAAGFGCGENVPVPCVRRMGDLSGEPDFRAGKIRAQLVERPGFIRQEADFRLRVQQRQAIGGADGQGENAVAHDDAGEVKLFFDERGVVQPELNLAGGEERLGVAMRAVADDDVFRDDAVDEPPADAGKFQRHALLAQRGDEARLKILRHAHDVDPRERQQHQHHEQPERVARPAEGNAAFAPETGHKIRAGRGRFSGTHP